MFTTDAALQIRTDSPTFFSSHTHQLSHTVLVKNLERVYFQDFLFQINREEGSNIVT